MCTKASGLDLCACNLEAKADVSKHDSLRHGANEIKISYRSTKQRAAVTIVQAWLQHRVPQWLLHVCNQAQAGQTKSQQFTEGWHCNTCPLLHCQNTARTALASAHWCCCDKHQLHVVLTPNGCLTASETALNMKMCTCMVFHTTSLAGVGKFVTCTSWRR